ncbi:hypothetical protein [Tenacibaculum phage JQ]|nr:hypothetical protein [Tenacibaculum phage JQ]
MYRIYTKSNYFYILEVATNRLYEGLSKDVRVRRLNADSTEFYFDNVNNWNTKQGIEFANIQDESGTAYTDLATFVSFYEDNTGKSSPQAGGQTGGAHYVDNVYTSSNTLTLTTGTVIPCNKAIIPQEDVITGFDNGIFHNNKLQAINYGDKFLVELRFKAIADGNNAYMSIGIDIGQSEDIREETFYFTRQAGIEQKFARPMYYWTGNDFIANGGDFVVRDLFRGINIYDIQVLPILLSKGN